MHLCAACQRIWRLSAPTRLAHTAGLAALRARPYSCEVDPDRYPDSGSGEKASYPLPWAHHSAPLVPREPALNRFIGLFFLRRIANARGYRFSVSEFLQGAKEAVFSVAEALSSPKLRGSLPDVLSPSLYSAVLCSLESVPDGAHMHLDVESVRQLQLCRVRSVVGATQPGDEHDLEWLGQRVVASRSELQALQESDSKFTFQTAREIGRAAANTYMEFQLAVSFRTKEKFAVLDGEGRLVEGSNQFKDGYHLWQFGSSVAWGGEDYPFSWTLTNINNYLTGVD